MDYIMKMQYDAMVDWIIEHTDDWHHAIRALRDCGFSEKEIRRMDLVGIYGEYEAEEIMQAIEDEFGEA